jgi:hypothetical protein
MTAACDPAHCLREPHCGWSCTGPEPACAASVDPSPVILETGLAMTPVAASASRTVLAARADQRSRSRPRPIAVTLRTTKSP